MLFPLSIYADYQGIYRLRRFNRRNSQVGMISAISGYQGFHGQPVDPRIMLPKRRLAERRAFSRIYLETRNNRERRRISQFQNKPKNAPIRVEQEPADAVGPHTVVREILGIDDFA